MGLRRDTNSVSRAIAAQSNKTRSTSVRFLLAAVVVLLGGATFVLARNLAPNNGGDIPSTLGTASVTTCSNRPVLTIVPTIAGGVERVGEIAVDNIPIECSGKTLVVEFLSDTDEVLDRVVWQLALMALSDDTISARANGTTVSSSNASVSDVSVNYPVVETGSSGLDASNLNPADIVRFSIVASVSGVAE